MELAGRQLDRAAGRQLPSAPVMLLPDTYSPLGELLTLHSFQTMKKKARNRTAGASPSAMLSALPPLLTGGSSPGWPALALAEPPIGKFSVLAEAEGGQVQLFHGREASPLLQEVFSAVFNASHLLPFRGLAHDDRDLLYFIKEDAAASSADILQLRRLGGRINLTVHEGGEGGGGKSTAAAAVVVDVRIHLESAVFNIRYGTSPQKEAARLLRHTLRTMAPRVWEREAESGRWTTKERRQLEATGTVPGYELEYRHSPLTYPELFGDSLNVQLVKNLKRSSYDRHRDRK